MGGGRQNAVAARRNKIRATAKVSVASGRLSVPGVPHAATRRQLLSFLRKAGASPTTKELAYALHGRWIGRRRGDYHGGLDGESVRLWLRWLAPWRLTLWRRRWRTRRWFCQPAVWPLW